MLYYTAFILNGLHAYTKTFLDSWPCCANNNNIIKYKAFKLFMLLICTLH